MDLGSVANHLIGMADIALFHRKVAKQKKRNEQFGLHNPLNLEYGEVVDFYHLLASETDAVLHDISAANLANCPDNNGRKLLKEKLDWLVYNFCLVEKQAAWYVLKETGLLTSAEKDTFSSNYPAVHPAFREGLRLRRAQMHGMYDARQDVFDAYFKAEKLFHHAPSN